LAEWAVNGWIQSAKRAHIWTFPQSAPSAKIRRILRNYGLYRPNRNVPSDRTSTGLMQRRASVKYGELFHLLSCFRTIYNVECMSNVVWAKATVSACNCPLNLSVQLHSLLPFSLLPTSSQRFDKVIHNSRQGYIS